MDGDREVARISVGSCVGRAGDGGCDSVCVVCVWCIVDIRFILLVSVGLMVLAPRPVAWDAWGTPGMTDTRLFPEPGVCEFLVAPRGDRGNALDILLESGV